MKHLFITVVAFLATLSAEGQTLPIYLDDSNPPNNASMMHCRAMTLQRENKGAARTEQVLRRRSTAPRLPDLWTDDGPHGVRPDVLWDEWDQGGDRPRLLCGVPRTHMSCCHMGHINGFRLRTQPRRRSLSTVERT